MFRTSTSVTTEAPSFIFDAKAIYLFKFRILLQFHAIPSKSLDTPTPFFYDMPTQYYY